MNLQQSLKKIRHHIALGEIDSAEHVTRRLRKKRPGHKEVLFLEGCIQYQKGNYREAVRRFRKLLAKQPGNPEIRRNLGVALLAEGRAEEAIEHLEEAARQRSGDARSHYNLGNAYLALRRYEEARNAYLKGIAIDSGDAQACNNLGVAYRFLGDYAKAVQYGRRAVALEANPDFYFNLIIALNYVSRVEAYLIACEALGKCNVENTLLQLSAFPLLVSHCDWQLVEMLRSKIDALFHKPDASETVIQDALLALNACCNLSSELIYDFHQLWGRRIVAQARTVPLPVPSSPETPPVFHIGYVSGDFNEHSVGLFIRSVLAFHNQQDFRVYCYSNNSNCDDVTDEIQSVVAEFRDIRGLGDKEFVELVRKDDIHILVDLSGHTRHSRVEAFAWRPAPVQITWLGYPNTTGLETMDYRITDRYAETEGGTRYTEELLYMPESFLCFGEFQDRPRRERPPCRDKGTVTFGSFNDTRKLTPEVVRVWSAILDQVPCSRLVIKARAAGEKVVQENIRREFARHGIAAERVVLRGFTETRAAHLDSYNEIDIALDTFPYNGTTTTCDALWMGVPVVTLVGRVHAQRVSYSILKNIGVEETIAETEADYIERAVALASDVERLEGLRARVAAAIRGSILCDPERFTRQLENLYREAWEHRKVSWEEDTPLNHPLPGVAQASSGIIRIKDAQVLLQRAQKALYDGNGDIASALAKQVLAAYPNDINARFVLGTAEYQRGNFEASCKWLSELVSEVPDFIDARLNLGAALQEKGRIDEAISHYQEILRLKPDHHVALNNLGRLHHLIGRFDVARAYLEKALTFKSDDWLVWFNLGSVEVSADNYPRALEYYERAFSLQEEPPVYAALVSVLKRMNRFQDAYQLILKFIDRSGVCDATLAVYGTLCGACDWRVTSACLPELLSLINEGNCKTRYISGALLSLVGRHDISPEVLFRAHRQWGEQFCRNIVPFECEPSASGQVDKLRIAYVSPDFRQHSVGLFLRHVLAAHNKDRFEVICYARVKDEDEITHAFRNAACRYINVNDLTMQALAKRIREDGIHILVDLSGHTSDTALEAFAWRPAPVQMTWLGYPNTTGLETMDYRITDRYAETEGGTRYTEALLYMPESFLCFGEFQDRPRRERTPCRDKGTVTFGSFNDTRKLTPEVVRVWSAILDRVPESRLVIKARLAGEGVVQENIRREFARYGIAAERVVLRGFTETHAAHLDSYNEIDIALDTFPYNGTTTTCEALWMGVPVVTLVGRVHAQRVSYSILKNIGVEETIAETEADYIERAVALASDVERLEGLRARVAAAIRGSILCDPERFTRQLENLYREAWERKFGRQAGAPASILKEEGDGVFRYLPELDLYLPHPQKAASPSQQCAMLNRIRQEQLAQEGRLLRSIPTEIPPPPLATGRWVSVLQDRPYALHLGQQWLAWLESEGRSAPWLLHQQALDCFAHPTQTSAERYLASLFGYRILFQLLHSHATLSNLQTFARLALTLGEYENCTAALGQLESLVCLGKLDLSEPFLPVVSAYDHIDPGGDWQSWLVEGIQEARRTLARHSAVMVENPEPPSPSIRSPQQRRIRVLHNLARTGGTLIAKCLGCMEGVVLLSEIHPKASERFNPLRQIIQWFDLFDEKEAKSIEDRGRLNFIQQINLIEERCRQRGKTLVVRDWSHYDFMAVPFAKEPTHRFVTAEVLELSRLFSLSRYAIVRHPIDQWLSLCRLKVMKNILTLETFLEGYRRYAEQCSNIGYLRYEDFVANPEFHMELLCREMEIPFDSGFIDKWVGFSSVTGDVISQRGGSVIRKNPRRETPSGLLEKFEKNADYLAAIELLGYGHPE